MYKDVKKKILSVAVCICMIIGMVQVVPKVKAADTPQIIQTVQATQVGDTTKTATFTIELNWCSKTYNGENQQPTIKSWEGVVDSTGVKFSGSSEDIAGLIETASSNAGSYSCGISSNRWNFPADSIKYEITKATFDTLRAAIDRDATVQYYNAQPRVPDETQIEVTAFVHGEQGEQGKTVTINPSQYEVTSETGGTFGEQTCKIQVKSDNYESNEWSVGGLKYAIAYNMGDKSNCQVTIDPTDIPYGPTVTPPAIKLHTEQTGDVTVTGDYFKITYYKNNQVVTNLNAAGTYTVIVEPKGGTYCLVNKEQEKCFAGKYEGTFNVTYEGTDSLRVFAKDPNDPNGQEKELSREIGSNLIMRYNQGKPVQPTITKILTPGGEDISGYCKIDFPDSTKIGKTEIKITPDPTKTNYKDPFSVYYRITSGLNIKTFKFQGADSGKTEIAYDGDVHKLETCVVTDEIGNAELLNGVDYNIQYQYWKEDEGKYVNATDEQLKDRGKKCALIVGDGVYQGNEYPLEYEITPIDLSQGGVTVTFAEDRIPYTGESITPVITSIEYKGMTIDKNDWDDEFTFIYEHNVDAGTATLKLRGKGLNYSKEYEYPFTITKLDLKQAVVDPYYYEYTRSGIVPTIKIGAYKLRPTDYKALYYDEDTAQKTAPSNVGPHTVRINVTSNNIDSTGVSEPLYNYEITERIIKETDVHLTGVDMQVSPPAIEWNGGQTHPGVIVGSGDWVENTDYTIQYVNDQDVSITTSAAVIVTGIGNYTGSVRIPYQITARNLDAEGVKHELTVTPPASDLTQRPPYTVKVEMTDLNNSPLVYDSDYTVKEIRHWDGVLVDVPEGDGSVVQSKENWVKLETKEYTSTKLSDGNLEISLLQKAGKYKVVFAGSNRYKGERTISFTCGKDISNYWVHIDDIEQTSFVYDGGTHCPDQFHLYWTRVDSASGMLVDQEVDFIDQDDYTVSYVRFDGRTKVTQAVGRIYVLATGNPEEGYYGKTKRVEPDKKNNYFDIIAPVWTSDHVVITGTAVEYLPNGRTGVPNITVTYDEKKLIGGTDYTLEGVYMPDGTINPALQTASDSYHIIYVVGIGNYESKNNGNRLPYRYKVPRVDIGVDANKIDCEPGSASFTDIDQVTITLMHDDYTLLEGDPSDPDNQKDYTKNRISSVLEDNGNYYVEYKLTGHGNYTGERTVRVPVLTENLSNIKESEQAAQVGEFFVTWLPSELLIKDPKTPEDKRDPIKPEKFTIGYKVSEKQTLTLKKGTDYEISAYGTNTRAGRQPDNWVRIVGAGGYTGTCDLPMTLYTDMTQAEPTDASLIASGKVIKKSEWKSLYEQNGTDALLELKPLSFGEIGRIDPKEYKLTWTAGLNLENPAAGAYKVIVNGLQTESHYYYGEKTFEFTIVDDIEGAQIVVGTNNTALYQGKDKPVIVTAAGVGITVKVDGKTLTLGTDYEITGHANNTQLGEATVSLKGIGQYTGDVSHKFKITYPISKLIVFVQDPNSDWVDTRTGTVQYRYTGKPVEPAIRLYCPVDFPSNATAEDYLKEEPLASTMYDATEFLNNTNAGTATIVIKNTPYFTDGGADPRRYISFQIGAASICPPPDGTVKYESSKYGSVNDMVVDYMGENYEVSEDFGITLHDGVLELKENEHYKVYFDGDRKNVSDPSRLPVIHFSGLGNYAGSEYEIPFTIRARSIKDALVDAPDVNLVYTDNMKEQQILDKLKLVLTTPRDRKQNLVFDTDYTIAGYYMDAGCTRGVPVDKGVVSESGRVIPNVPGDYYVQVVGKGNFKDERAVHIVITKRDLTDDIKIAFVSSMDSSCIVVDGVPDCTYNGEEHRPAVEVTYGIDSIKLRENRDYTVSYDNNVNAGDTAKVTVTMIDNSNYKGSAERFFTIMRKDIGGEDMNYLDKDGKAYPDEVRYDWTKQPVHPTNFGKISDMSLRTDLEEHKDYTIEYHDDNEDNNEQRNAGKVKMTFVGSGNYTGEKVFTYYIGEDISRAYTLVNGKRSLTVEYNGLTQAPDEKDISVEIAGSDKLDLIAADGTKRYAIKFFKNGFEYENRVNAEEIIDAGVYYVAVVGVPELGTYAKSSEENTCIYTIKSRSIGPSYILVSGYDGAYYYTGQAIEPKGITVEDTDLPVSAGAISLQKRSVKLTNGKDYTISYANNISAGKASIIVTGKGNYGGTRTAYFNILSSDTDGNNTWNGSSEGTGSISNGTTTISASDIMLGYDNSTYDCMMYNGYERIPTISINGISANEFTVTASNNVRPGVATLMISGRGNNYTGTILKNFKIMADLSAYGSIAAIEDQVYTGYQITPQVTLTCGGNLLNQGSDYTVTYMNNTGIGRATVMATASSNSYYIGTATGSFNISNTAGGMEITGYASSYTYTGYAITPDVVVTMNGRLLNRGTDYVVSYSNNTNVGTATMTVSGIGSFSGTKTINYTIEAKNIENCITTAVTNYKYTGNTYTPSVTITDSSTGKTLVAGTDYTIVYSNNTNPGTASITVTALSKNYTGSKVIPFKITSAAVSGLRASAIKNSSLKLSWTSQDYADGYQICNSKNRVIATTSKNSYTVKGLSSCTTYKYKVRSFVENTDGSRSYGSFSTAISAKTRLNTPKLKAASTSKGKVTLTWTKISKATGYEIYYSTKKNGIYTRLKTISKSSTRKYVDSGLASGEKYYYTIRAYRTTNGVKTYSSYNTIKAVRVK